MQEFEKILQSFGLNEIEARIYKFLIGKQPISILNISRELSLPRTSVYDNTHKLIEKGLAEKIIKYKTQLIRIYPPEILENIIDKEKERIEQLEQNLDLLKSAFSKNIEDSTSSQVRYYQGVQGFRQMMWNSLSAKNEIIGYSICGRAEIIGEKFYKKYIQEFKRRKLKDRIIITPNIHTLEYINKYVSSGNSQLKFDGIRVLKESEVYISGDTSIYNNVFAVCYWKHGEIVGVEIENAELVKSQKTIFELLWKIAKPYK